jgi:carboxypeptidase PM20D1
MPAFRCRKSDVHGSILCYIGAVKIAHGFLKGALAALFSVLLVLAVVLVARTILLKPLTVSAPSTHPITFDQTAAVQRFAATIRVPTISQTGHPIDVEAMAQFRSLLQSSFPRVHAALTREVLPSGSILYTWRGRNPAAEPVILMGHMDVVPVDPATENRWQHPPFSGDVADGSIWGRGTLDDKGSVVALMEATEALLAQGFTPARTVIFAFGDDEENGGQQGAASIVKLLQSRGIHAHFVVDEGGAVASGFIPGLNSPLAVIGIAEKGYLSLKLSTTAAGGHSSEPPPHTAIGELAAGLTRLEEKPFSGSLPGPTSAQLLSIAPYLPFGQRLALANLWLTRPLIVGMGLKDSAQAGGYRTTTAITMIRGGTKDNVLPTDAEAVVNFRILPGETVESVTNGVRSRLDDPKIAITNADPESVINPSPVSPTNTEGFRALVTTIHQLYPTAIASPYLVQAATDARHYYALSSNVYRFAPLEADETIFAMIHGFNEHITTSNYIHIVEFEAQLLNNID